MNPTLRILAILFLLASTTFAQTISLPTGGQYRPGEYIPLVIEADGPGLISVRAAESLGIDWDAPGKTSVTVAWMTWRQASGEMIVEVNGRPQAVSLHRLATGEAYANPNPYEMPEDIVGPRTSRFGDAAYLPSYAWPGGLSTRTRWMIVGAAGVVALVLAAIKLAIWRSRWTPWVMIVIGIGATIGIASVPAFNRPVARAATVVEPATPLVQSDRWIYLRATQPTRASERWSAYTMLFPRSPRHLEALSPVVRIDADGLAGEIELSLTPGATACLLDRVIGVMPKYTPDARGELESAALRRRLYED